MRAFFIAIGILAFLFGAMMTLLFELSGDFLFIVIGFFLMLLGMAKGVLMD